MFYDVTQSLEQSSVRPIEFNERLLQQNAELSRFAADAAKETRELRDAINDLRDGRRRSDDVIENGVQVKRVFDVE